MLLLLPVEVVENIFDFLDRESLINCSLTCRNWKLAAEVKLRETVTMNDFTPAGIIRLKELIKTSSNVADKVKHIDIARGYSWKEPITRRRKYFNHILRTLDDIFQMCRNIETITGIDVRIAKDIWSKILGAVERGNLRQLQSLPTVPECLSHINDYYAPIAWGLRSSLKKRDLRCNSLEYRNMLERDPPDLWLYDFISLEELTFYFGCKTTLTFIDCNDLIDICNKHPSINSLVFRQVYRNLRGHHQSPKQDITSCTNIKELTILPSSFLNEKSSMLYLIFKFPNLTYLCIDCPYPSGPSRKELFDLLAEYISHINEVQLFYSNSYQRDDFLPHLLESCNMTSSMVELYYFLDSGYTYWVQVNQSQSPPWFLSSERLSMFNAQVECFEYGSFTLCNINMPSHNKLLML